jgi:hypothetical protein
VAVHIEAGTFASDLSQSIKTKEVKSSGPGMVVTVQATSVKVSKYSSAFFSKPVYFALVTVMVLLSWAAAYRVGVHSSAAQKVEMTTVEERAPLNGGNNASPPSSITSPSSLDTGSLESFANDLQAAADSRQKESGHTGGGDGDGDGGDNNKDPKDD